MASSTANTFAYNYFCYLIREEYSDLKEKQVSYNGKLLTESFKEWAKNCAEL